MIPSEIMSSAIGRKLQATGRLIAGFAVLVAVLPGAASAAEPVEGSWAYNYGEIRIAQTSPGNFKGTVVEEVFEGVQTVPTPPPQDETVKHEWDVSGRRLSPDRGAGIVSTIHGSGFAKVSELTSDTDFGGSLGKAKTGGAIVIADRRGSKRSQIAMVITGDGSYGEDYRADGTGVGGRAVYLNVVTKSCPNGRRGSGNVYLTDNLLRENPVNDDDRVSIFDVRICGIRRTYTQTTTNPLLLSIS